jgi:hypothetical protein
MADIGQCIKSDGTVGDTRGNDSETNVSRRQYNFRIVLGSQNSENPADAIDPLEQRRQILDLKQPERHQVQENRLYLKTPRNKS